MNKRSIYRLACVILIFIFLISCNNDNGEGNLSPSEISGTYSNKLSDAANGDSLILSYNENTFIGKEVYFKTENGETADIILKYILPHEEETTLAHVPLTEEADGYSFSGTGTTSTNTTFSYEGKVQFQRLILNLSDIIIPDNSLTAKGTWYIPHSNASYYNVENGGVQTMIGMLYNLIGGRMVGNLISSVLDNITFREDGNIIANYAPLPESTQISSLISSYVEHDESDWITSPANLATYYVEDDTILYVTPQIDMIVNQITINQSTKAEADSSSMITALLTAYQTLNTWSTTGIQLKIRQDSETTNGGIILILEKSEIQELFSLLDLALVFLPEETLETPVTDWLADLIPAQYVTFANLLLQGKTIGEVLEQLREELETIPIEIGLYLS